MGHLPALRRSWLDLLKRFAGCIRYSSDLVLDEELFGLHIYLNVQKVLPILVFLATRF
jgi:hypothetical protein